jgi:hypothetical protein
MSGLSAGETESEPDRHLATYRTMTDIKWKMMRRRPETTKINRDETKSSTIISVLSSLLRG